jgi:hypothetical protein
MRRVRSVRRGFFSRFLMGAIAVAVVGWGLLLIFHPYGDNTSDYERAIANCMADRTRAVNTPGGQDVAATACVRETPGDQSRPKNR